MLPIFVRKYTLREMPDNETLRYGQHGHLNENLLFCEFQKRIFFVPFPPKSTAGPKKEKGEQKIITME